MMVVIPLNDRNERKELEELKEMRTRLLDELKQIRQKEIEEMDFSKEQEPDSGRSSSHQKRLGAHPGTGNFFNHASVETREDNFSQQQNGFINQFLMIIIGFCFLSTLYMIASFLLL